MTRPRPPAQDRLASIPARTRMGQPPPGAGGPDRLGRRLLVGVLVATLSAPGCDPNPTAPAAIPPPVSSHPPEAAKKKAENPLIQRD